MTEEEVRKWLEQGEGVDCIFLPAQSRATRVGESLVALANVHGGRILLGVRGRRLGRVEGLPAPEETRALVLEVAGRCSPSLILDPPEVVYLGRAAVLVVTVPAGLPHVYHWRGRYLHRVKGGNIPLSGSELLSLLLDRGEEKYESLVPPGCSVDDLDMSLVAAYMTHLQEAPDDPLQLLQQRGYVVEASAGLHPTYAGLLLFGRNPQAFAPQARIRLAFYPGTTPSGNPERHEIEGTLPEQLLEAEAVLRANMRRGRMWVESERVEVTEYPMEAVRETVVNAVAHRDYSIRGDGIRVSMFQNRIEVYSPGRLPGPITVEGIREGRFSRNPMIAQALADMGLMERLGYGMARVVALMEENHLPPPAYREMQTGFLLTLYGPQEMAVDGIPADPKTLARLGLNERQVQALLYVDQNGQITTREYQELCSEVSAETLRRDLLDLVSRGLLLKIGERRATYYILK